MSQRSLPDAHRGTESARLHDFLSSEAKGLRICGISGPGGVGKSYLLRHVLESEPSQAPSTLRLEIDGANEQARGDFFALVDGRLARSGLPSPWRTKHDYFPHVRRVASLHRDIVDAVAEELSASPAPEHVKDAALALLKLGLAANKMVPKTQRYFNVAFVGASEADLAQRVEQAWELVRGLRVMRGPARLPGPIRDLLGRTYASRVKNDLYNVTADALIADLTTTLSEEPAGRSRLLLVIDDFEALAPALEEFLVGALIPRLADAPFSTALIVLGRDDLDAMHPGWSQHCRRFLQDQIRLQPLPREAALDLLARAGVPEPRRAEMYESTQGFPFLLTLLIDELGRDGGDSALFLRKFFDRTTRWMSAREREWLLRICYLDSVNVDSLSRVFPLADVEEIQDWFEREASIRDPSATTFRVRPLIKEKVLRYQELRAPSRHAEMTSRGKGT